MTPRRYIDWCITTPIMLITTIIFMEYQHDLESKNNKTITMKEFFYENKENIMKIVLFNALMLLFGFLGETNMINKPLSVGIGFFFFYLSFKLIYDKYAQKTEIAMNLYKFLIVCFIFKIILLTQTPNSIDSPFHRLFLCSRTLHLRA